MRDSFLKSSSCFTILAKYNNSIKKWGFISIEIPKTPNNFFIFRKLKGISSFGPKTLPVADIASQTLNSWPIKTSSTVCYKLAIHGNSVGINLRLQPILQVRHELKVIPFSLQFLDWEIPIIVDTSFAWIWYWPYCLIVPQIETTITSLRNFTNLR